MIHVLAGVNGAGKSSIGGSAIRSAGGDWYNPDAVAREMQWHFPDRPMAEINSVVWQEGLSRLRTAIYDDADFVFETTLGGSTMTNTLLDAIAAGVDVRVWYCGLSSPALHIERVAARVARGGHTIPEDLIRTQWQRSMRNLCRLAPGLNRLAVFDNSRPLDIDGNPQLQRLLYVDQGAVLEMTPEMPEWAKPVAAVVMQQR